MGVMDCCLRERKARVAQGRAAGGGGASGSAAQGAKNYDPDEKWSNLYREREKNHLYKWVGVRTGESLA